MFLTHNDKKRQAVSNDLKLLVNTFVFLQAADLLENGLQVHVEPVAVAEQLQEVAGAQRAAGVVDELTGRGQAVGKDLKLLPLRKLRGGKAGDYRSLCGGGGAIRL